VTRLAENLEAIDLAQQSACEDRQFFKALEGTAFIDVIDFNTFSEMPCSAFLTLVLEPLARNRTDVFPLDSL
jgi:hypothetical protein